MANVKLKPSYRLFNGVLVPRMFKEEHLLEVTNYKPTSDDVFIVTYPKCGTTWMQIVALYIFRKGQELENYADFGELCPFLDRMGMKGILEMPRPGAFKTHLPYNLMPYSPEAKYIFVLRNPKDTCVSLFYHAKSGRHRYTEGAFDDFFELFMAGEVESSDYFDHLASWYPHRNDKGIFHTTYEDMKEDMTSVVLRLAKFLGHEYIGAIEKDNNVLSNILRYSGFEYMKKHMAENFGPRQKKPDISGNAERNQKLNTMENSEAYQEPGAPKGPRTNRFRKGIVGDWRSHFSEQQSARMNQKFLERFGGTEIYEKYKPFL